ALARGRYAAAELLRHGLHAVADAQYRHAEFKHGLRRARRILIGHRFGTTGEDDATGAEGAHLGLGDVPGVDLAVHPELAHAARDQLGVLGTEVEDQNAVRMNVRVGGRGGIDRSGDARHGWIARTPGSW